MSHTYSQLLYHLVFSTKYRESVIEPRLQAELYPYIGGIVREQQGCLLAIGGMPDHIHLLVRLKPTVALPGLLRAVKASSSHWVHQRAGMPRHFQWQEGYGAFTVGYSGAETVRRYIQTQEEHHRHRRFETEWTTLLQRHEIEFDAAHPFGGP
jgi:putative transposase